MRIEFDALPDEADAAECVRAFRAIFPRPGAYLVEPDVLAKAAGDIEGGEGPFETWFLAELEARAGEHFDNAQLAMWDTLDRLLIRHRVTAPSELEYTALQQALFDLKTGSTAEMVGVKVAPPVAERLRVLGWPERTILDFPAVAYRMGAIYDALTNPEQLALPGHPAASWGRVLELAHAHPLTADELLAVNHLRTRAGIWLTPILDESGRAWTADRELAPLRRLTARVIEDREHLGAAMTRLRNSQRARGVVRDARRVIRTEIAEARSRGLWQADGKAGLAGDARVIRTVSSNPCRACAELYLNPDGTPRPYRRADLERMSAVVNSGPRETWTAKIGPTHPNCVCGPWREFREALRQLYDSHAPENRELLARIGAFREAA